MVLQIPESWSRKTQIIELANMMTWSSDSWFQCIYKWGSEKNPHSFVDSNIWKNGILYLFGVPSWLLLFGWIGEAIQWVNRSMDIMSGQSSTSLWPLLWFFAVLPLALTYACSPLYWFYFVHVLPPLCVGPSDSRS